MILKASTRGSPMALGRHLTNAHDNEHIHVHEVDGFFSQDLMDAMSEMEVLAKGIRSRQPLFSVSMSPPQNERVGIDVFERAIADIEERTGLTGQPRVVVFHEKEGRRHAHAVWSRIDAATMTVKKLPFYKMRLQEIAKDIHLEQGWDLPKGFVSKQQRDPNNFTLAEWQQAKREGLDPKKLKMLAAEAWALGRDRDTFARELEKRGLYLANGDRRSHVAMSYQGEVYALSRLLGKKTKDVRQRLGEAENLRSVDDTRTHIREVVAPVLHRLMNDARQEKMRDMAKLDEQRFAMMTKHRLERARMEAGLKARQESEARERSARLQHGLAGLWQTLSGKAKAVIEQNQREAYDCLRRDRAYAQSIIDAQLEERQKLQADIVQARERHFARQVEIHRDFAQQADKASSHGHERLSENFNAKATPTDSEANVEWLKNRNRERQQAKPTPQAGEHLQWLKDNQRRTPPPQRGQSAQDHGRDKERGSGLEP